MRNGTKVVVLLLSAGIVALSVFGVGQSAGEVSWGLGAAEGVFFCAGIAVALAVATGRARSYWLSLPLVVAVTLAQPFGARVDPVAATTAIAGADRDPGRVESIDVLGLPLARFRLESAEKAPAWGESGYPTRELKVRSWIPPLLLINATPVVDMCGVVTNSCWKPDDRVPHGSGGVALFEQDGRWHVRTTSTGDSALTGRPVVREWRLSYGVVSWTGTAYWALLAVALMALALRARRRVEVAAITGPTATARASRDSPRRA